MKNVISQSLGLDPVNINVYAKVYQNIPPIQEIGLFSPFQNLNLGNASANLKWHLTISCQYQCVCRILSKYSKRFRSYRHFSRTGQGQNLHKQVGDKIFTNCPVTKSNDWSCYKLTKLNAMPPEKIKWLATLMFVHEKTSWPVHIAFYLLFLAVLFHSVIHVYRYV